MSAQDINNCYHCQIILDENNWYKHLKRHGTKVCKNCTCERSKPKKKIQRLKLRLETMLAYGNKCVHCGENRILFLTLDHIHNNGYHDMKGVDFYAFLKGLGFPGQGTQLQILCHNCNAIKELNLRQSKQTIIRTAQPEIYSKIEYSISEELDTQLWEMARELFYKLNI